MHDINWDLLKFKYEVLGTSIQDLALEHSVSEPVLKFNSQNWKQIPLASKEPLNLEGLTSIEDVLIQMGNETSSQTKAFAILKQKFLGPKYVELETVLLHKAVEMAQNIKLADPGAASTLTKLTNVLTNLLEHNPLLTPGEKMDDDNKATEWKITVVDASEKEKEK